MAAPKRIVCYAINGSGLGHLTRLVSVARWLRRYVALLDQRPPEVLFLTSSDASDVLSNAGFAAFKIPSKTVARKAELNKLEYRRLAKHFVWNALGVFAPDLFVVDTFPAGSFDELFQVLDGPFKKGFVFRNVKPEYAARPAFRSAIGLYDTVVVPHCEKSDDSGLAATEARHCGEIIQFDRAELLSKELAREQLGVAAGDRVVYVSAGGGGDPQAEATLANLIKTLGDKPKVHLLVGAGPLYRGNRFSGPRMTWFDSPNVWRYFAAVDAAISAGGYNTFHELLFAQVPSAFYAQPKIADDQLRRIQEASALKACRMIPDVADAQAVGRELEILFDPVTAPAMRDACAEMLSGNGAQQCALELLRPLYDAGRLSWAKQVLSPRLAVALEGLGDGTASMPRWLDLLLPIEQMQATADHPGFATVLEYLSPEASAEVRAVLATHSGSQDLRPFEECLLELLDTIRAFGKRTDPNAAKIFADEMLKTLAAAIKKQLVGAHRTSKLARSSSDDLARTIEVMQGVQSLLPLAGDDLTECDVLRFYRMFPKIVDASAQESFDLFARFIQERRSMSEPIHETIHHLQVLKMTEPKLTQAKLETMLAGSAT